MRNSVYTEFSRILTPNPQKMFLARPAFNRINRKISVFVLKIAILKTLIVSSSNHCIQTVKFFNRNTDCKSNAYYVTFIKLVHIINKLIQY